MSLPSIPDLHASAEAPRDDLREVFTGVDVIAAAVGVGAAIVLGLIAIPVAALIGVRWPWVLVATALAATAAAGRRYRLGLSTRGIKLDYLRFWILPSSRQRWLLDADIDLYQSFYADAPEGLCIMSRHDSSGRNSRCFGPGSEAKFRPLHAAANAALARLRAAAPACPPELRHPVLTPQAAALDVAGAARYPGGRLRELTSIAPVALGALVVPTGSRFRLNGETFIDARRDDRLLAVEVAAPVVVYGRATNAGALIHLDGDGTGAVSTVHRGFASEIVLDGKPVRGDAAVGFTSQGELSTFTLARETTLGGFAIPAGSKFLHTDGLGTLLRPTWTCFLGAPLALPETTLAEGDMCALSADFARLTSISPRQDLVLPAGRLRGGIAPIPVTPDGRVDVAACRKMSRFV